MSLPSSRLCLPVYREDISILSVLTLLLSPLACSIGSVSILKVLLLLYELSHFARLVVKAQHAVVPLGLLGLTCELLAVLAFSSHLVL